eukprot:m.76981 g.76981  ORF g.76981 m.76981 type:complete len:97 (+) comp12595_c0_seq1:845-1135(+)
MQRKPHARARTVVKLLANEQSSNEANVGMGTPGAGGLLGSDRLIRKNFLYGSTITNTPGNILNNAEINVDPVRPTAAITTAVIGLRRQVRNYTNNA